MNPEPNWTYTGAAGPDRWADLDAANTLCRIGRSQSPIDLAAATAGERGDLAISYHLNRLTFTDTHRTLKITADPGGVMTYEGLQFGFVELHFHAASEHTFDGRHADLEAHFVHAASDGSLAVVGVVFSETDGQHPVDEFVSRIPAEAGGSETADSLKDIQRIIPVGSKRYRYEGSLTTPPCSEGVRWIVMQDSQPVGRSALTAYTSRYPANNRPVQPRNDRTVTIG